MRGMRLLLVTASVIALTVGAGAQSTGILTPQIEAILKSIKAADKGLLAVSEEDGRFLRVLIAARGA